MDNSDLNTPCDVHSSSDEYARRFSGPIGAWLLEVQARSLNQVLAEFAGKNALDVGGGHGQLLPLLIGHGCQTTLFASSAAATKNARQYIDAGKVKAATGDIFHPPFPEQSFDLVCSIRILSHADDWKGFVRELCRLSRDAVIVDYPTFRSVNIISRLFFPLKKLVEKNTRTFTTFWEAELAEEFKKNGFILKDKFPQFFFPMALHRGVKQRVFSESIEAAASALQLTKMLGSPVLGLFKRID
jgi:SAM-dependent methyltransferase